LFIPDYYSTSAISANSHVIPIKAENSELFVKTFKDTVSRKIRTNNELKINLKDSKSASIRELFKYFLRYIYSMEDFHFREVLRILEIFYNNQKKIKVLTIYSSVKIFYKVTTTKEKVLKLANDLKQD